MLILIYLQLNFCFSSLFWIKVVSSVAKDLQSQKASSPYQFAMYQQRQQQLTSVPFLPFAARH